MSDFLFVYGTLRRGQSAAHLLAGARFMGEASISGDVILQGGFPGLIPGNSIVAGELFQVRQTLWESLDEYEGPAYRRQVSDLQVDGATVSAWVYWLR